MTTMIDDRTAFVLRERGFGGCLWDAEQDAAFRIQVYLDGQLNEDFPINGLFSAIDIAKAVYRTNTRHLVNGDFDRVTVRAINVGTDVCVFHTDSKGKSWTVRERP